MWLKHDSGEATELQNQQVLGDDSPLEFDENGFAEVDEERGRMLLAMHRHVERGGHGPDTSEEFTGDPEDDRNIDDSDGEIDTLPFNPEEKTVGELEEEVANIDDAETVNALYIREAEHENRKGARKALRNRWETLGGGEDALKIGDLEE